MRRVLWLALGLRLVVVFCALAHFPAGWFFTRGQEMGLLGDALAHGRGLSSPFGPDTGPTAMIAPGYPLLIAAVFRVLGSFTLPSAVLLMGCNIAFNVLTAWLLMRLAARLAGQRAAILGGMIWAISPPLLWMPTIFWETSISCCILLAMVELAMNRRWRWMGTICALGGLVNPALLPSLLAVYALAAWRGGCGHARKALVGALLFIMLFAFWPLRNARVFHAFIGTRTTVGLELWMGNHQGSTGYLDQALFPTFNPAELNAYRQQGELVYMHGKGTQGLQWVSQHPVDFLRLTGLRFLRFWTGTGSRGGSWMFAFHALLTSVLGAYGLWKMRGKDLCMLALPLLLFPLPYYVTHAEFRYRLIIDPLLTVLAGCALGVRSTDDEG